MKFAFSSNAYTNYSLKESISDIAKIGYQGVEIMCDSPHAYPLLLNAKEIEDIKDEIFKNDIQISNLNAFTLFAIGDTYHPSWIEEDLNYRKIRINHTINCLNLAKQLGAENISVEPGGPVSNSYFKEKYFKIFIDSLSQVLPVAEEQKVKILVEPEPGLLIENSDEFLKFMENFDSRFVGLNFDIGHFVCVNEDPSKLIYKLIEYIHHFHLADIKDNIHNHLIPGFGSIDFKKVLTSINDISFDGFITVELYPYKDDPSGAALKALNYLKEVSFKLK